MTAPAEVVESLAAWLEASPAGTRVWVRGLGTSLAPLLGAGDAVQVERCGEGGLARGDLALGRSDLGGLTAHVVVGLHPVRTASLHGVPDPPLRVLGRAVALERRGRRMQLPPGSRLALRVLVRILPTLRRARSRFRRTRDDFLGKGDE